MVVALLECGVSVAEQNELRCLTSLPEFSAAVAWSGAHIPERGAGGAARSGAHFPEGGARRAERSKVQLVVGIAGSRR